MQTFLLIAVLFLGFPFDRQDPSTFYIDGVEVRSKYDSRYIFERIEAIAPPDKPITRTDINCLVNELKSSGIFQDVSAELIPTGINTRKLILTSTYHHEIKKLVLGGVTLVDLPAVDQGRLRRALRKRDVRPGARFLTYYYGNLEARVAEALRELFSSSRRDELGELWITIRMTAPGKVQLIASSGNRACTLGVNKPTATSGTAIGRSRWRQPKFTTR